MLLKYSSIFSGSLKVLADQGINALPDFLIMSIGPAEKVQQLLITPAASYEGTNTLQAAYTLLFGSYQSSIVLSCYAQAVADCTWNV